jgi:hypothetical protein
LIGTLVGPISITGISGAWPRPAVLDRPAVALAVRDMLDPTEWRPLERTDEADAPDFAPDRCITQAGMGRAAVSFSRLCSEVVIRPERRLVRVALPSMGEAAMILLESVVALGADYPRSVSAVQPIA